MAMHTLHLSTLLFCSLLVTLSTCYPMAQEARLAIPPHGADGYEGDQYFQYINVPRHKEFEWGYRRGNPHHFREEYLSQKDHKFKAKVKWGDVHGGHGEHFYDINHAPKYDDYHHVDDHKGGYHKDEKIIVYHDDPAFRSQ